MPSASKTLPTSQRGKAGDVRCQAFTDNSVLCDHLILRDWKLVCPGCRQEHNIAEIILEARRNGANLDDLMKAIYSEQPFSLTREVQRANALTQQILHPLREKLRGNIKSKFPDDLVEMLTKNGYRVIRIPRGITLEDIDKAHEALTESQTWSIWPENWEYGSDEFDDVTIGRDLRLKDQQPTHDHLVLWRPGKLVSHSFSLNFAKGDLDKQVWETLATPLINTLTRAKRAIPHLADFLFALLTERIITNNFSDQEQWVDGAFLKLIDNDGQERTGHIVSLYSTERHPDSMVFGIMNWDDIRRERSSNVEDTIHGIRADLLDWFVFDDKIKVKQE